MRFRHYKITAGDYTLCLFVVSLPLIIIDLQLTGGAITKVISFPFGWLIVPIINRSNELSVETTYAIFSALQGVNCIFWVACIELLLRKFRR